MRLQLQPQNTGHSAYVSVKDGFVEPQVTLSEFAGFGPYLLAPVVRSIEAEFAGFDHSEPILSSIHDPPLPMQRSGSVSSNSSRNDMKEPLLLPPTALETYGYPDASVSTAGSQRGAPRVSIAQTYAIFAIFDAARAPIGSRSWSYAGSRPTTATSIKPRSLLQTGPGQAAR